MERILKENGAERVSAKAKDILRDILEDIGGKISERAIKIARHSGRKTIKASDVKVASDK